MSRFPRILLILMLIVAVCSCDRTPSYVIGVDDMSKLLADIYVAEGVVDQNHMAYISDSSRILLRQSVYARHGVDQERFDTSMVWYGHHMDKLLNVYDGTIKILQQRERALGTAIVKEAISMSGDSVDVWPMSRYLRINERIPSRLTYFSIPSDENTEPGDVYIWRIKVLDGGVKSIRWNMLANYTDSTSEWLVSVTSREGWNEMTFASDSTKTISALKGYFEIVTDDANDAYSHRKAAEDLWIDSVSLIRKRSNPDFYVQRGRLHSYPDL